MILEFEGEVIEWRGPAPFLFVPVPSEESEAIRTVSGRVSYGWGCIPVTAKVGATEYTTSLFPKDGSYLVPVKVRIQKAEGITLGDSVRVRLSIELS